MTDPWARIGSGETGDTISDPAGAGLLVLADLSGSGRRSPAVAVDRDDLDALLARLAPRLDSAPSGVGALRFSRPDDFTPLGIVAQSRTLQALLRARESAEDPLDEVAPTRDAALDAASGADVLDALLGDTAATPGAARPRTTDAFDRALRDWIDATPSAPRVPAERQARVDAELRARLGAAFADARFRALEASWLGLRRLLRTLETGEALRVRVVDTPRAEAAQALAEAARTWPAGEPAALAVACFAYAAGDADCEALAALARAAEALGCGVLADATPALLAAACSGELAHDPAWRALRAVTEDRVRLVGPRVLGRDPYDDAAVGAEGLGLHAEDTLPAWVGGAVFAAQALVAGTRRLEWLPAFAAARDGERVQVGPAERVLTEREIAHARAAGLVVLAGLRGEDALIVAGIG